MNYKFGIIASTILLVLSALISPLNINSLSSRLYINHENLAPGKEILPIQGAFGPESLAFDPNGGGPYTGVSDGRIIKWITDQGRWIDFAVTSPQREGCEGTHDHVQKENVCGRPLGLRFNQRTGDLFIADAYMGLVIVGLNGGLGSKIAYEEAQGNGFRFANGIDIDQTTQVVYFTHSSARYPRRNYIPSIVSGDKTGSLMKYDPETKQVSVLLSNLSFPNGVALSEHGDFVLVAESTTGRILRLWLRGPKSGTVDVFAELAGFPDNIKKRKVKLGGGFWVGVYGRRTWALDWILSHPWIGKTIAMLPIDSTRIYSYLSGWRNVGLGIRVSENGEILEEWKDKGFKFVSEVEESDDGLLFFGSVKMPFVAIQKRHV